MNLLQRGWYAMTQAVRAFNKNFFSSDEANAAVFESLPARLLRYEVGNAFYEGRQWSASFSQGMKVQEGLYKYIQDIYNPAARIGDFYKGVIWRGALSLEAKDEGAIPIHVPDYVDEARLRAAIAKGWQWSNMDVYKTVHVLHGTTLGDAAWYIRDDIEKQQVRAEVLHPSLLKFVEMDARGYVKRYVIEEPRLDENGRVSTYRETCEHGEGDDIIFKTFRNNAPYAWDNPASEWVEKYGFIPLVLTQHINEGRDWGRAEIAPYIRKIANIDDEASMLNDQIRKVIDPSLLANFAKSAGEITFTTGQATTDNPKPGREQSKIIYVNKDNGSLTPVVVPLDIAGVTANIRQMLDALEGDLPELRDDIQANVAEGTVIAARSRVESKVQERRTNYDKSIVRVNQMLVSIAGMRGYDGFQGYDLGSYKARQLDHSISPRAVFPETEDQKLDRTIKKWNAAADVFQKSQGMIPVETVLLSVGFTDEEMVLFMQRRNKAMSEASADIIPTDPITGKAMNQ